MPRQKNDRCGNFGIQRMLTISLAVFAVFCLLVLTVFQVGLLDTFYRAVRNRSMDFAAKEITTALQRGDEIDDIVYDLAEDHTLCVLVFRVENGMATPLVTAEVTNDCILHHTTGDYISDLYVKAMQNGNSYRTTLRVRIDPDAEGNQANLRQEPVSAMLVRIVTGADGIQYTIFLDAKLTPMNATIETLTVQFALIAALLFAGVLVLAYVLSRVISRPLIRMNASAKLLAKGQYDAHFSGDGYRETRELAQTLNYAAEELSRVDGLQKELIANISHDLRTPLTMITGYSEVMRDIPGENTPENVQVIIDEAEHLSALVNDLLDLSRVQSGARQAVMEEFDLTETVRATLLRYDKLTHHDGYTISFDTAEEGNALVCADRGMILQVVYNLINNAINYCGEDRTVLVTQRKQNGKVRLSIIDHGEGIPPEQIGEIWNRYYKIDRVHRRAMVGTGLGLSIVKEILDQHGSDYGVESTPGVGSTFWFELPAVGGTDDGGSLPNANHPHSIIGETVEL